MSLTGVNIKPEWGLYHGTIGKVVDIVYINSKGPHHEGTATDKLPEYVLVDFPQYCGPSMYANDKSITSEEREKRKTWVAIPMVETRCKHNMCTRLYMPLSLAFAKSIHSFQGATVGPTPPGRPENTFLQIVADPGTRQFESTTNGLFYTLLSRVTTIGDMKDLTKSAIFFIGDNMNSKRIKKINRKKSATGHGEYYEYVKHLHRWVDNLDQNAMAEASQNDIDSIIEWTNDMMREPVERKEFAKWVNDIART